MGGFRPWASRRRILTAELSLSARPATPTSELAYVNDDRPPKMPCDAAPSPHHELGRQLLLLMLLPPPPTTTTTMLIQPLLSEYE
jgi:hypothetical protein